MTNTKLIGFSDEKAKELIPRIAQAIRENAPELADSAVITHFSSTCVSAADTNIPTPYICICNTVKEGSEAESEKLKKIYELFGFDIEFEDIKAYFPKPDSGK